jgi:hypothetical protein
VTALFDAAPDALPPLTTQYKDPKRIVEYTNTPMSCASMCEANEGRCAMEGDSDSEVGSGSDYRDCFRRADWYVPRAHYENDSETQFSSQWLECGESAATENNSHSLYALECCCILKEPHWLANDVESPISCAEVCSRRGLECQSYDLCRLIPNLCSSSFPEFFVQSIAHYAEDGDGTGMETYPTCGDVPGAAGLQSHSCVCM